MEAQHVAGYAASMLRLLVVSLLIQTVVGPCDAVCGRAIGEEVVEGGVEGEGEGEGLSATSSFLHLEGGVVVEDPLALDDLVPVGAGRFGGAPVVVGASVVDGALDGDLVIVVDPLGAATRSRVSGVFVPDVSLPRATVAFADLDGDGAFDLAVGDRFGLSIVLSTESGPVLSGSRAAVGRGSLAIHDVDDDGHVDVVVAGFNGESTVATTIDGTTTFRTVSGRHRVGDLGYCLSAFGVVDDVLCGVGEVCAAFDPALPSPPRGSDRLFTLDAALAPIATIDTGLEAVDRAFTDGTDLLVAGFAADASLDRVGPSRTIAADPALENTRTRLDAFVVAVADIDGSGTPTLVVESGGPPAAEVLTLQQDTFVGVVDLDGDGDDDVVVARRAP